MYCRKGFSLDG
ncbi:hypothetical protein F383_20056 [Gossypium arboreum]|uniref:Uncharacterized protein n=1 Tax=Gossypium arboreum TaxID=29729 RepID=A0A0B0M5R7_GOSAR|nr:hypothetical protein F383_36587 [Gossypium arboreum]KHG13064.1 hypothetical protein F383_17036 [Gossypium arboreum]KHG14072.1 hypothetical protein F383_20056 [Gossypium arboreum]